MFALELRLGAIFLLRTITSRSPTGPAGTLLKGRHDGARQGQEHDWPACRQGQEHDWPTLQGPMVFLLAPYHFAPSESDA